MKVWMLAEAFTLTEDHTTIHDSLAVWATPCADEKAAMRRLRKAVRERIAENYEGLDDARERVQGDMAEVMSGRKDGGSGGAKFVYSTDDREIVWRVYPCEVEPKAPTRKRGGRAHV